MTPETLPCPCCGQPTQLITTEGESGLGIYRYAHTGQAARFCHANSGDWGSAEMAAATWQLRSTPVSPWISVDVSVPFAEDDVLILLEDSESFAVVDGFYDGEWILNTDDNDSMLVTHWMPIPDPPIITLSS